MTDKGDQLPLSEVGCPGPRNEETRPGQESSTGSVNLLRGMEALLTQLVAANQPRQSSVPQLVKFDPDEPDADIEGWCKITEVIVTSKKIEGADLLVALTQSLKGRAASCLMQLDVSNLTWPRVKETLMAKLARPMQPRDNFDNILRFQISNKETAAEAAMRLWNAVERIPRVEMPEEITTGFVTSVLCYKDPLIRRELNCQTVTTRAQLCRVLTGVTLKRRIEFSETYDNDVKRFKGSDNRVFKGVCHRCGNPGHKQAECNRRREDSTKPHDKPIPTCYACGKTGHLASTCPNKTNGSGGNGATKEVHVCQQQPRCARSNLATSSVNHKMGKVNDDLQRERDKCNFNVREMTEFIDGGPQKTRDRKKREEALLTMKDTMFGDTPDEYLSHKEKYEVAVKKAVALFSLMRKMQDEGDASLNNYRDLLSSLIDSSISNDGTPLGVHYMVFLPVLMSQANDDQQAEWLPRALNCNIIGTYAQTELGHGTFIRGLETTATYDPLTEEFVINSPTLTAFKWWAGGMGQTSNYCILIAQLHTQGQSHGIHSFIVQLRDEDTHMPLPGIKIGEIGAKMGLNSVNNGFLGFDNVRIKREQMLMRHAQVLQDGTYIKSRNSKLSYGGMVFVRVVIVYDSVNYLAKAVTIATRYSAVRRQGPIKDGEPECQILDYVTQQHKIFPGIAACLALKLTANVLWDTFNDVNEQLAGGNLDRLPELHALACCLKAVSTSDTSVFVERCRLACGGHGYMHSSNLPLTYCLVTASCTYEGENTVLLLQTARYLAKTWQNLDNQKLTPTVAYLKEATAKDFLKPWDNTVEGIIRGFQTVSMRRISSCVEGIKKRVESGISFEDAWNLSSVQLVTAAEMHCRVIILSTFHKEAARRSVTSSPQLKTMLDQLVELYTVYWALERLDELLRFTNISNVDIIYLQNRYEQLLVEIRPNAVGLVDSFDIIDELLQSTLGARDGRVYERLMEEALKSPLNKEPVNKSFHRYLKPFMQGKL